MRLAEFIDHHPEAILREWEPFAATLLPAARHLDSAALRDHSSQILRAIAIDLRTWQSADAQEDKGKGLARRDAGAPNTAAETHATLRAAAGFTAQQLVAEYRALRASIMRLWLATDPSNAEVLLDVVRFNEAVDQAVAESVDHFTQEVERWRSVFLGVLGHELRGPLNTVLLTSRLLAQLHDDGPTATQAARLTRSGLRMKALLDDLLDFNRSSLGIGVSIRTEDADLGAICSDEIDTQLAASPPPDIRFEHRGRSDGRWDPGRMKQLLSNLIGNALKYGDPDKPVKVRLESDATTVRLSVANSGPALPADWIARLFEPLHRSHRGEGEAERTSLGLGLFIVRLIARGHGGEVGATSAGGTTTFTVTLPVQ
jgi:signal transduction histidine kinase